MGLGFGAGLLVGARAVSTNLSLMLVLVVIALAVLAIVLPGSVRRVILSVVAGAAFAWTAGIWTMPQTETAWTAPDESGVTGVVSDDPSISSGGATATLIWRDEGSQDQELLVFLPVPADVGRGDVIHVAGRIGADANIPMLFADSVQVVQPVDGLEVYRQRVRSHVADAMVAYVPGSAGSLTLGLLIGDDSGLSRPERSELRASGLAHITAVSGWNVSVVVVSVGMVFRAFGARRWYWLALQLILLSGYVWIVGLEPPIIRAAIMGAVALVALHIGRPAHMFTLLVLTAGLMSALDPPVLASLSFQLSFLAMVGLALAARICRDVDGWEAVFVKPTVAAATAGLATSPLLAAKLGTLPLLTMPANILAGPLIPMATFAGMFIVATTWLGPLAEVGGWLAWTISSVVLFISSTIANIPGAHHQFTPLGSQAALAIYAALAVPVSLLFPEGRAVVQRLEAWVLVEPLPAGVAAMLVVGVLATGVVLY